MPDAQKRVNNTSVGPAAPPDYSTPSTQDYVPMFDENGGFRNNLFECIFLKMNARENPGLYKTTCCIS